MWPSHGHPCAYLHISISILPPYSTTLPTFPIATHPLPPSHVLPLYPLLHCSCNVSYFTILKLSSYCMPVEQLPTSSSCNPTPTPTPFLCTTIPWAHMQYHCMMDYDCTLTYEYCFCTAPYPLDMVPGRFYSGGGIHFILNFTY